MESSAAVDEMTNGNQKLCLSFSIQCLKALVGCPWRVSYPPQGSAINILTHDGDRRISCFVRKLASKYRWYLYFTAQVCDPIPDGQSKKKKKEEKYHFWNVSLVRYTHPKTTIWAMRESKMISSCPPTQHFQNGEKKVSTLLSSCASQKLGILRRDKLRMFQKSSTNVPQKQSR